MEAISFEMTHHSHSVVDVGHGADSCQSVQEHALGEGRDSQVHQHDNQEERSQQPIQSRAPRAAHLTNNQLTLEIRKKRGGVEFN